MIYPEIVIGVAGNAVSQSSLLYSSLLERRAIMKFNLKPLTSIGLDAEVMGIDVSRPLDKETRQALCKAWIENAVLVIRPEALAPPVRGSGRHLREIMEQQLEKFTVPDYPLVGTISSRDLPVVDGKLHVRGENFHTDHSNYPAPPKGTTLHAVSLPSFGGDTQFVDVRAAYDEWKPGDMVIWDNRSVTHQANADYEPSEYRFLYRIMLKGAPLLSAAG